MKFAEKLSRLTADENKARLSRAADLPPNAINDYINKGHRPGIDNAIALARALKVPLEWLVDDAADWPAPKSNDTSLEKVDDDDLMFEVCKRHRRELVHFVEAIDKAERADWSAVLKAFAGWKPGDPLPGAVKDLPKAATFRWGLPRIQEHDPWSASEKFHSELRGAEKPISDFKRDAVFERYEALATRPDFLAVMKLLQENEQWTAARVREEFIKDGWVPSGRGFVRPEPAVPAASKPVHKPSKPPSKPQ